MIPENRWTGSGIRLRSTPRRLLQPALARHPREDDPGPSRRMRRQAPVPCARIEEDQITYDPVETALARIDLRRHLVLLRQTRSGSISRA